MNRRKHAAYVVTTTLFGLAMLASGAMNATAQPPVLAGLAHLGYPAYLAPLLGVWKLLGVAALAAPGLPRLKEWAYAGFAFNLTGAFVSHLAAGDGLGTSLPPLVLLAVGLVSWALRPEGRRLASSGWRRGGVAPALRDGAVGEASGVAVAG